ncbi:MAG: hypothetical protein QME66_04515 [Candidatus Eisenbacteria bacterium]|nr:hypothetical protein [Candidatus Eisenbacteria bacterium]
MKRLNWQVVLGICLVGLSAIFYILQIAIFERPSDTLFYFFQDLAF